MRAKFIYESIKDVFKSKPHKEIESAVCRECPIFCEIFREMFPDEDFNIDVNDDGSSFDISFAFNEGEHLFFISQSSHNKIPIVSHLDRTKSSDTISGVFTDRQAVYNVDNVKKYMNLFTK